MNKKPFALVLLVAAGLFSRPACALRPFDGTDADVAPDGVFELELGPFGLLREGRSRSLFAPAAVGNIGLGKDSEFVVEGRLAHRLDNGDGRRTSLEDAAVSIKRVLRNGSLQDGGSGVSVAMECSLLLPGARGEDATGAGCAGIASQRFAQALVHLNAALSRTRARSTQRFLSMIVVGGSEDDAWHPVAEVFITREDRTATARSVLLGMVVKRSESMHFDVGVRRAGSASGQVIELRAGLTWMTQR